MPRRIRGGFAVVLILAAVVGQANARSLNEVLPNLFPNTGGGGFAAGSVLRVRIVGAGVSGTAGADALNAIQSSITGLNSLIPIPSASAGFTYQFDKQLDLFVRTTESLGPIFTERAQTLGEGKLSLSFAYTRVPFSSFEGTSLDRIGINVPVGAELVGSTSNQLPGIADDVIRIQFQKFSIDVDDFAFFASYGITDRLDVSVGIPLVQVVLKGTATATVEDPKGDSGQFGSLNRIEFDLSKYKANGRPLQQATAQQLTSSFDESSFGLGDPLLRAKYRFLESAWVDAAGAVTITIPAGGADDFRGYHNVTGTPVVIFSKTFGFISPHVNAGFAIRDATDVGQALWAAGADLRIFPWLTVAPDFLGFQDVYRSGNLPLRNIYQYSFGFKVNPYRQLVLGANFQFPLNQDGLRADVIYTGVVEYTF